MIVRESDKLCVICGAVLPERRQVCPICGTKDEAEAFAQLIRRKIPKEEDLLATAARDTALKIKDNAILRVAIERRDSENNQDGWYE